MKQPSKNYKKYVIFRSYSHLMKGLIAFLLFVTMQYIEYICLAEENRLERHEFHPQGQKPYWLHKVTSYNFSNILPNGGHGITSADRNIKFAVAVIENRFIAKGIITDIKRTQKDIQKFSLQIRKIGPFKDYPNFGGKYLGKEVEIFSEIGIPSSFRVGIEVSVVLRVSGDEWGQTLFLVEVIENGTKN